MLTTNKLIMIDEKDYEYMKEELERLRVENKRLHELSEQYRSEAFQARRELYK